MAFCPIKSAFSMGMGTKHWVLGNLTKVWPITKSIIHPRHTAPMSLKSSNAANALIKLFSLLAVATIVAAFAVTMSRHAPSVYSPETSVTSSGAKIGRVGVWIDDSEHYSSRPGSVGDEEFRNLAPYVEKTNGEFSPVAMVHQLQCLQVIREEYATRTTRKMAEHCLQYLRQSVLCAADTRLESVRFSKPPHVVALPGEYECRDWTKVMEV